jgi:AraC family carnitine catabolism transcriptional activator
MEEHIEDTLSQAHIAAAAGLSQRQLERLFRTLTQMSPVAFYRQLRLDRGQRLLTYSRMPVRDVALATGFSTLAEFSRAFKSKYGRPPSHVRKRPAA